MKSLRERYAAALVKAGEKQVPSRSGKYLTFTRRSGGFYFIGRSGALRIGPASTKSHPITDAGKQVLLDNLEFVL